MEKIFITGAAGFIGLHVAERLLASGHSVVGLDSLNDYYDVHLKEARLSVLRRHEKFEFHKIDLSDPSAIELFKDQRPRRVVHLAAQAGVRYSLTNPGAYSSSNLVGFVNVLEACRQTGVEHLVFASSSSVYGANTKVPFSVHDNVDHPVSLYAATKKANELMAHTYSHLFGIPATGLRFFTVYGPWGRPDMAYFSFTRAIFEGKPIDVYNNGRMQRDFTYIDDIADGVVKVLDSPAKPNPSWNGLAPDPASSRAPYRIYNIGNNRPVELLRFIEILEELTGRTAQKRMLEMQPGDVPTTFADIDDLARDFNFRPSTSLEAGLKKFVEWYRRYYSVA